MHGSNALFYDVAEAKAHLFELLGRVYSGEEIVIARAGRPVARLVPLAPQEPRTFGQLRGQFTVPDDFGAPMSEGELARWEWRQFRTPTSG